jgi:molecular chaperone DnaK
MDEGPHWPMSDERQPLIGIDLGTTNSVVAYIDPHGRPITLPNADGDLLTPSVVYFEESGPAIVGREAMKAGLLDPANLVEAVKRDMGKDVFHREIRGKWLPPAAISGVILHRLIEDAAMRAGPTDRAVVTVPAYFNEPRRKATMDAARMAGLKEVELVNEPTAAALAFGYQMGVFTEEGKIAKSATKVAGEFVLLVYDLGGGTFDVTLMRIRDRHFRALVCEGDVQLGGRDWDDRLVEYACECFEQEFGIDLRESPEAMIRLRLDAEESKRALSQRSKSALRIAHNGHRQTIDLTRDDLRRLTDDLLSRTRLTCELVLKEAKMKWSRLDAILLVGGASRMPMVRDMLVELSGMEPNRSVSPDEAVANGAALYAHMLWGREATGKLKEGVPADFHGARITNVNAHSLGVVGRDMRTGQRRVVVLITKNSPLPRSSSKLFRTQMAGQRQIRIPIVEGESPEPIECAAVGECRLVDLPGNLPEGWPVKVSFAYRRDGRIFVEAEVQGHEPVHVEIDRKQKISQAEAETWASELIGTLSDDASPSQSSSALPASRVKVAKVREKKPRPANPADDGAG